METEIGNRHGQAENLEALAGIYRRLEQPARAVAFYRKALEMQQEIGDRRRKAELLRGLGDGLIQAGETGEGLASLEEALELSRALELPKAETLALLGRGKARLGLGDAERAWPTSAASSL